MARLYEFSRYDYVLHSRHQSKGTAAAHLSEHCEQSSHVPICDVHFVAVQDKVRAVGAPSCGGLDVLRTKHNTEQYNLRTFEYWTKD